ncbi:MAG: hypothetical protein DRP09_16360 [Candidatus Thorarchaeota archaeon]|nr:MAG: hypothetical protein DRP09_16360 [Candidatus Thorarchaeota archaeon]
MKEAVIVDNNDSKAILSVDDLIMKIGLLVVESMQKERIRNNTLKRMAELEKKLQELKPLEQKKSELTNLEKEVNNLQKYKELYDNLSKRYTSVVEEISNSRSQLNAAKKKIETLEKENHELKDQIKTLTAKKKKSKKK